MHKSIFFVLLCLFYSTNLHAMEATVCNDCSLSGSVNVVPNESGFIQNVRIRKNDFDRVLDCAESARKNGIKSRQEDYAGDHYNFLDDLYRDKQEHEAYYVNLLLKPFLKRIKLGPTLFLDYCYYLKHFKGAVQKNIAELISCPNLFRACQEIRKDNYSALGAVIMAHGVSVEDKRDFIQKLMLNGFELTQNDKELAALNLYDVISTENKAKMILLLCDDYQEDSLSQLLPEIRKYIVQYLISLFNKQHGLLLM